MKLDNGPDYSKFFVKFNEKKTKLLKITQKGESKENEILDSRNKTSTNFLGMDCQMNRNKQKKKPIQDLGCSNPITKAVKYIIVSRMLKLLKFTQLKVLTKNMFDKRY